MAGRIEGEKRYTNKKRKSELGVLCKRVIRGRKRKGTTRQVCNTVVVRYCAKADH